MRTTCRWTGGHHTDRQAAPLGIRPQGNAPPSPMRRPAPQRKRHAPFEAGARGGEFRPEGGAADQINLMQANRKRDGVAFQITRRAALPTVCDALIAGDVQPEGNAALSSAVWRGILINQP